jgi:tripartite-type tricarboxylate transporter receptor subunit TctC
MKLQRRQFIRLGAIATSLPAMAIVARAQAYPARSVRIVVNLAAGGGTDFLARLIGEYVSRGLGQQLIIENKVGAGGLVGAEAVAKSAPDGYTLLASHDVVASAPPIASSNVDYLKTLLPVIQLSRAPLVLAVHPSLGVSTVAELIVLAKRRPGMSYATSGVGTQQHYIGEWFAQIAGIKLDHVPYRGAGQAVNDLVAGHVRIGSLGPTPIVPHHRAGTLRILAQSGETRSPSLPDVPTFQEAGVGGLALEAWNAVFAPSGTQQTIVARLNSEIDRALSDPAIRAKMLAVAQEPVGGSAEQLALLVQRDSEKYARLAKLLNIKADRRDE